MAYNYVTVQAKYTTSTGTAAVGKVTWFPTAPIVDATAHITIAEPVSELVLDANGMFSVALLATDNSALSVFGWGFIPYIGGVPRDTQYMKVLFASGATQWIDQLPSYP